MTMLYILVQTVDGKISLKIQYEVYQNSEIYLRIFLKVLVKYQQFSPIPMLLPILEKKRLIGDFW